MKAKSEELFHCGIDELEKESDVLPTLDAHESWVVSNLQGLGVPNKVDWSQFGLSDEFRDVNRLVTSPSEPFSGTVVGGGGSSSNA